MPKKPTRALRWSDVTPREVYLNRRALIAGAAGATAGRDTSRRRPGAQPAGGPEPLLDLRRADRV